MQCSGRGLGTRLRSDAYGNEDMPFRDVSCEPPLCSDDGDSWTGRLETVEFVKLGCV